MYTNDIPVAFEIAGGRALSRLWTGFKFGISYKDRTFGSDP